MIAQQLVTGGYSEEKVFQYNNIAGFFWDMGPNDRHGIAIAFSMDNPDFLEFWKMYTLMAVMKDAQSETKKTSGSVYFLQDDISGNVKVGSTKGCPVTRTNQIKGMNHTPLTMLFSIEADKGCEGKLHNVLRGHNVHHEWFEGNAAKLLIPHLAGFKEKGKPLTISDIESFAGIIGKTLIPNAQLQIK